MFNEDNMDYMMQHNGHFNSETMHNLMRKYYSDSSVTHHMMNH
jgi:hypothetical protein